MPDANADVANLSIQELQHQLKEHWVRCEKAVKLEMAPLLYHLRTKLKKQGSRTDLPKHESRTGEGFAQWVKTNLGLSLSTVNRWANEYAVEHGKKKPKKVRNADASTSNQMTRSSSEPNDGQFSLNLIFTEHQQKEFCKAQKILGQRQTQDVIFNAVVKAAQHKKDLQYINRAEAGVATEKKAPAAAHAATKRRKVSIQ
jgi:hypothetical protein